MKLSARHPSKLFGDIGRDYFAQLLTACPGGEPSFRSKYLPVAERLALAVQDLPLEKSSFSHSLGALQFGLLCGLTALRLADGVIFDPAATAQRRMIVEPQYRYAAWCAAIAGVPLLIQHHLEITIAGQRWSYASSPASLYEACGTSAEYEISWRAESPTPPTPISGIILLGSFFYPGQFADFDHAVLTNLAHAINPGLSQAPAESSLARVVRTAQEKVKALEKARVSKAVASNLSSSNAIGTLLQSLHTQTNDVQKLPENTGNLSSALTLNNNFPVSMPQQPSQKLPVVGESKTPIPPKIVPWIRALIAVPEMAKQFLFLPDTDQLEMTYEQFKFGGEGSEMFAFVTEAELVISKIAGKTVRLNSEMTNFVKAEFARQGVALA